MNTDYILVTPARNEARFLPGLIDSVVGQRIRPQKWVIVSDNSTDETDSIAAEACRRHCFISLVRTSGSQGRSFSSKAIAFQKGFEAFGDASFDFVGNLDADVTFEPRYYERLLHEMDKNALLGVCSGVCWDKTETGFRRVTISVNHAVGAMQFFRKECFEAIGGYRPATVGGVDSLATLTARMKGWQTRVIADLPFYHHKPVDSANARSASKISYRAGLTEYHIGTHPLFAIMKALRRWNEPPWLISPFIRLCAYGKLWATGVKRDAPDELVKYLKKEQLGILLSLILGHKTRIDKRPNT